MSALCVCSVYDVCVFVVCAMCVMLSLCVARVRACYALGMRMSFVF